MNNVPSRLPKTENVRVKENVFIGVPTRRAKKLSADFWTDLSHQEILDRIDHCCEKLNDCITYETNIRFEKIKIPKKNSNNVQGRTQVCSMYTF